MYGKKVTVAAAFPARGPRASDQLISFEYNRPRPTMVKQSRLLDLYRARGATLIKQDPWLLPAHFGDPIAEYHLVRNHVGILDLCQRSLLRFTGGDRATFLNDTVSNDLTALSPGQGLHAAFLDSHGKILADARIFCSTDFFLADVPEPRKEIMLRHLKRGASVREVQIADLFANYTMLSVQGPYAVPLVEELAPEIMPTGFSADLTHRQGTRSYIVPG